MKLKTVKGLKSKIRLPNGVTRVRVTIVERKAINSSNVSTGLVQTTTMRTLLNPLLLDNVLERVLESLPKEDLQRCRAVSKLWKAEAERILKKRHSVTLRNENEIKQTLDKIRQNPKYKYQVSELIAEKFNLEIPLFTDLIYKLQTNLSSLVLRESSTSLLAYQNLMRMIGPNLNKLELGTLKTITGAYHKYFPIPDETNTKKHVVFPNMKNLEWMSYHDPPELATLLSSVCKTFPNLVKVNMYNLYDEDPKNLENLRLPYLKSMQANFMPNDGPVRNGGMLVKHMEGIMKLQLNLKSLRIYNVNQNVDADFFKKFIESQSSTLEELDLCQTSYEEQRYTIHSTYPAPTPFPLSLPNLECLRVTKPFVRNLNHVINSCPKLKEIYFDFHENSNWQGILTSKLKLNIPATLKSLTINWIDPVSLSKISASFNTVAALKIHVCDDELLRVIFEKFVKLRTLLLFYGASQKLNDEGFSGLTSDALKQLKKDTDYPNLCEETVDNLRTAPHVGQLKKLGYLYIQLNSPDPSPKELSFWGIWNLPMLHTVDIMGAELSEDTKDFMDWEGFYCIDGVREKTNSYLFVKEHSPFLRRPINRDLAECLLGYNADDESDNNTTDADDSDSDGYETISEEILTP